MSGKRNAESTSHGAKKQRFDQRNPSTLVQDEPEDEDTILELDEIGKAGRQTKRNAVKIDGYDTDSSTENFDQRAEARHNEAQKQGRTNVGWDEADQDPKPQLEEDNDMFADVDQDMEGGGVDLAHDGALGKKKTKEVHFMDSHDIVGQVDSSHSGGHVKADFAQAVKGKAPDRAEDVESSSDSGDDLDRDEIDPELEDADELGAGAKKRHAPKIDAFNLKQETEEEGKFDETGNFVRKATDKNAVHDAWLNGFNKKDVKKAKEAHEQRERDLRRSHAESDSVLTSDLLSSLIKCLAKAETPLEALQRLGSGANKKKITNKQPAWKRKKVATDTDAMQIDQPDAQQDQAETQRKTAVEAITDAADKLLSRGQVDIYDAERELLVRQYTRETGEDWIEPHVEGATDAENGNALIPAKQWEYRWADARDGGERHGPYDAQTMVAWNDAGYFGEDVEYRAVGEHGWSKEVNFL